ncbi:methionine synthase [Methanoculleus sp. FWC-SCC1]|uniref:Methionine synthase n=1 Tax=Methanoculleus frigidifontis TaxID=2584085 RepID=A0ABT8MDV5_9EURY|nr:methionine synthase [Methanoculleus sp. FWC-SCC1]MDN7026123.1 methionine synthase [Methanoculleus sp. FWC-SCC1]
MTLISKTLPTTVVGSYPVVAKKGLFALDPLKHAVETAVADQLEAGIDIISDGQVRGDMVQAFTSRLPGIKGQAVVGKVQPPAKPLTVADTRYALSKHAKVKGILTGPSTLAHALKIETPMYRNREELALDLAQALAVEARYLEAAGVTLVQIDEPIFSTGAADLAAGRQAVNAIVSSLRIPTCLHVCGDLASVIDEVLKVNVAILDFEFAVSPGNLEVLSARDLRGRSVGYGCVDSSSSAVESVETIVRRIETGIEVFGARAMLVDPDCGLRMQSRETASGKLKNMVAAAGELRPEYT